MPLRTIAILRGWPAKERGKRFSDWALLRIANRLPKRLIMWTLVVAGNRYWYKSGEVMPEMKFVDVLRGFDQ
jgi:hypothetical protein